jgi:hypothetical protein
LFAIPSSESRNITQEATLRVDPSGSWSLPAPQGTPVLLAENGHLKIVEMDRHRQILDYPRTLVLGWAPDGKHFFVNNEIGSNITELSVFDRAGNPQQDLEEEILGANLHLQTLARSGSHMYFDAKKWIDARTLEVEVSGHSDSTPSEEFDNRFRVTLDGMVTKL